MKHDSDSLELLLVDDDDVACESVVRGLRKHDVTYPVHVAHDGIEALEMLRAGPRQGITGPIIVLLDLNMPRMNGFEFLQELRSDPDLYKLVVFVLTTSRAEYDIDLAYAKNIAGYLVKTAVGPQFRKLARLLDDYGAAVRLSS